MREPVALDEPPMAESALLYWQISDRDVAHPEAILDSLLTLAPDVAILDLASPSSLVLDGLPDDAPFSENVETLNGETGSLLLLSRLPILSRQSEPDVRYRVGGEDRRMRCGILDVTVQPSSGPPLRIVTVSAKNKIFDPAGQSEMRRNELRLVTRHVQQVIEVSPQARVILIGALNDTPDAAALRGLIGGSRPLLQDLRPVDTAGDAWTSHEPRTDEYVRNHYALLRSQAPAICRIPDDPALRELSCHRPLWIGLTTKP